MNFITPIQIPPSTIRIGYEHRTMIFGSCFAEAIGQRLSDLLFPVDLNPFGILYNPDSIAAAIRRLMDGNLFTADELTRYDDLYHSLLHHGSFSAPTADECLERINARLSAGAEFLAAADRIIVTFGTSYVYRWKGTGAVVGNCHKMPDSYFRRERLSVDKVVHRWNLLLDSMVRRRPTLKWIFTVSPVRHLRDGHYAGSKELGNAQDYLYPHSYPGNWVKQDYLPDKIKDANYFTPNENGKYERALGMTKDKIDDLKK